MSDQLSAARAAVDPADAVVGRAARHLAEASAEDGKISVARLDQHQALAYDLAHAAAAVEGSQVMCTYGEHGEVESMLARAYVADAIADVATRIARPRRPHGASMPRTLAPARCRSSPAHRAPEFLEALGRPVREARHRARPTSPTTSSWSPTRSAASPTTRSAPSPSTSTARTPTCPRRSSPASPSSAASASRCPRSTAVSRPAASPTTSAWSSRPRSCRGARSASAARSSRVPRSSRVRSSRAGPRSRSRRGCRASPAAS